MQLYYATIDINDNVIEVFKTELATEVKPQEDYHQIIRIEPCKGYRLITRYNSVYDLLDCPF